MLRPNSYLTFTLEGDSATADVASAIKRGYSYVAPVKIVAGRREAAEGEPALANRIELEVRMPGHSPWVDETWDETLMPWLAIRLDKLFGTVRECNTETRPSFCGYTHYGSFDLVLCGVPIRFALEPNSQLRNVAAPLTAIRAWMQQGRAAQVERIAVPSDAERADADWFEAVLADGTTERVELAGN